MNQNRKRCWVAVPLAVLLGAASIEQSAAIADTPAETEAIEKIEEAGGTVTRGRYKGQPAVRVVLQGAQIGDEDLGLVKPFENLANLELKAAEITDAGMK